MQLHQLSSKTKSHRERRIGRGGKRGTYSGRGIKGQGARAGAKFRPAEREILKKIPKLRGRGKHSFKSFRLKPVVVNLGHIEKRFKSGDTVTPESLLKSGLITKIKGRMPKVKILGQGELKKNLIFKDVQFSKSAAVKLKH
ncbi:MAG: uL15 family ribosomal protein [Candidatus Sungbacteria bacterium]|nr:uL15 family ribosomal protein [Candidatus Sungbacteria bacterium]